jgi:hypothetical protein
MFVPLRCAPHIRNIKRSLLGAGSVQSEAYQQEILCAEEKAANRPAIFLPGQIDRVTGTIRGLAKEEAVAAATSRTTTHPPTIAYHIKNAALFDGSIYRGRLRHFVVDKSVFKGPSEPRHLRTVGLASSPEGCRRFHHWLADDCTAYMLAEKNGQPLCLRQPNDREGHRGKYQAYFSQDWTPINRALIGDLIIYHDIGQNSLKRARYRILRERVRAQIPCYAGRSLVYLRRGALGVPRIVQNEEEIIDVLAKHGVIAADIESDSLEHLLGVLATAKIVISVEGSNIAHCIYSVPDNCGLIALQPPDRFVGVHRTWSECLGMRFGFVVGALGERGYCFSSSEILHTIDLMLRSIELEPVAR